MTDGNQKIRQVLSQMSVREKALALTGSSMFKSTAVEALGVPKLLMVDGGTGVSCHHMFIDLFYSDINTGNSGADELINDASGIADTMLRYLDLVIGIKDDCKPEEEAEVARYKKLLEEYMPGGVLPGCFPPGILIGATWDRETAYALGEAVGKEADYYKVDVLLGTPNVNIQRDPLGGRGFEGYSEDPCLTAKLAPQFVKGVQSCGIAADCKHFAANNQETDRRTVNEHISQRALHEIYLPGFKACVQEGNCRTVMSAYNAINGTSCALNPWLLTHVLREKWGFDGFVVSDWGAVYDQVQGIIAGNDLDMPGPRNVDPIVDAVARGELDEAVLDTALERLWTTALALPCVKEGHKTTVMDEALSQRAAYAGVREGMVLLKNAGGALPLCESATVSIYGEKSKKMILCGGGSANVITNKKSNLFDAVCGIVGCDHVLDGAVFEQTDAIIVTVGTTGQEGFDRKNLDIDRADKRAMDEAVAQAKAYGKKLIVVINACGPVDLTPWLENIDAILCLFIPGMEGGNACADALFGRINPSGKLPITFPKRYRDCPTAGRFPGWNNEAWYGEDIFVGYRGYDYKGIEPLYPFGFGLSYTDFTITDARLNVDAVEKDTQQQIVLTVKVKNTGAVAGKEVVQLYVGQQDPTMAKPDKELKNFEKVFLQPGEEKEVSITLTVQDLASYDPAVEDWVVEPDVYHLYVGNSSRNITCCCDLTVTGYNPYGFNENTTMGILASTEGVLDTMYKYCPKESISKESIEWSILFQPSGPLSDYWIRRIEPLMDCTEEEKKVIYKKMLADINRFK